MFHNNDHSFSFTVVRIGVSAAMNPGVRNISLDILTDLKHRQNIATKPSPESQKIRTLEEEAKNLALNKKTLLAAIGSSNEVTTTFTLFF